MSLKSVHILGMRVDKTSYTHASGLICDWAKASSSRYVCVATVNNVMESFDSRDFCTVMNEADLVTPDGMPLVWGLMLLGRRDATRVYGPDLTPQILAEAERLNIPVGFYGGSNSTLARLLKVISDRFPALEVAYSYSPPFRPLSPEEDEMVVSGINSSGAKILFIGLNTPKQDFWMAAHRNRVASVMVGVGAAFDFLSGSKPQAPRWMMRIGFEWLFRLITEPKRLWRRYLKHNPRFVALFGLQLLGLRKFVPGDTADYSQGRS
jgi:N-acetylglucosaminyldiphosphoundecaprenol N-acetyl-beta-D-mannosaminyltransferase